MQHGVGAAAHSHHYADGVLERGPRHDLAWGDVELDELDERLTRCRCVGKLLVVDSSHGAGVRQAHPHGFDGARHGVGRVHPAAGTGARAGCALDGVEGVELDAARSLGANGLEDTDDGQVLTVVMTGLDGAAVEHDGGDVEPAERDHRAWHVLVTTAHRQHAVHALATADGLDAVGDHLSRYQAALHAFCAHRDAVGDGEGTEQL